MGLFQELELAAGERKLAFLVIGGLAVNHYGVSRQTADLDLLVPKSCQSKWRALLSDLGYAILHEESAFLQFAARSREAWPVDLMLVADSTFEPMLAAAVQTTLYGTAVRVPALEHLLALKLHALKHSWAGRFFKDFLDVESLVRANAVDLHSDRMKRLFLKYGTAELYEKIKTASETRD